MADDKHASPTASQDADNPPAAPSPGRTPRASSPPPAGSINCRPPSCRRSLSWAFQRGQVHGDQHADAAKRLAFASKTPGRTQHINLFALGPKGRARRALRRPAGLRLRRRVARCQGALAAGDGRLSRAAAQLAGVVLMVDSRLGFTDLDLQLLDFVAPRWGQRRGQAAGAADQGRQAQPPRGRPGARRRQDTLAARAAPKNPTSASRCSRR